ncbi:MAG: tetratricopeptide repeat protein [Bacteroidales bacterium]|nr:tetratricopeptide repeat protein [Bacteroidales bacterium]
MKVLFGFILLFTFLIPGVLAQKDTARYGQYHKVVNIEIENDSLSDYIISIKNDLLQAINKEEKLKIAENNLFLAKLYYKLNSFDIAIEYNIEALELFEEVKDTTYIIYSLQNISAMYGYIGNSTISIEYSNRNLELCKQINDTVFMEGCYINLATSNMRLGNKKEAFEYYDKALKFGSTIKDDKGQIFIYNNIGTYYFHQNDFDSANYYFKKGLNAIADKNTNSNTAAIYANIAETDYYLGDYGEAVKNAQTSIKYFDNKNMVTDASNSYQILIKAFAKLGKTDNLTEYLDHYIEIQQVSVNKRKTEHAAKLKILYDINKFELEIETLTAENELKESKLAASMLKLYLAGVVIFLGLIILVVIIIQNARIKKSHKKIVDEHMKSFKVEAENIKLKKVIRNEKFLSTDVLKETETENILFSQIVDILETKNLYKNPDFNLNLLSKELNTNRSYVSKAINIGVNKTFVEFVNDYRVAESKRLLCNKDTKQLTIEAIGKEAGFNSKSTFFRVFKSITGVTPSFFLNNMGDSNLYQ